MTMPRLLTSAPWLAAAILLASAVTALALGGDYAKGAKVDKQPEWPDGTVDLANDPSREFGHWVNANDFFYYRGDAATLNAFLARYAKLTDTPLAVELHLGPDQRTGPLAGPRTMPYDWKMDVMRRGWGVPLDPNRPAGDNKPGYVVTVHVWLGDKITLKNLQVPDNVEVRSAGDIERFIKERKGK
jgi:hypothetical protein